MTPSNVEDYGVKVSFDNSDFNDNIDSSEKKLTGFQNTLSSFASSIKNIRFNGNINLGEILNFAAMQTGIYQIKNEIEHIADPIETVAQRAVRITENAMQQVIAQIKSGGMQRALNIEAAKFQIEGLKLDVDTFMEAADYAVSGTAYSLDAAAKAASQLGASGITQLDELKKALRGISGVAAMANTDFESIAHIFTTVAGQGKLMTMQLQSLSYRGLNIAAELAKSLNKSEAEIRDMVSKGKIDFKTFAMAMDDAFGEHAKDANKTFTGATSNIRASLSRIGEAFATPYIQDMVGVFNEIRLSLNALKAEMADNAVFSVFAEAMEDITNKLSKMIKWIREAINESALISEISLLFNDFVSIIQDIAGAFTFAYGGEIKQIADNISVIVNKVKQIVWALKEAIDEVFGIVNIGSFFTNLLVDASELLQAFEVINDIEVKELFENWLTAIKSVISGIAEVFGLTGRLRNDFKDIFGNAVEKVYTLIKSLKLTDETIDKITRTMKGVASVVSLIGSLVLQIFNFVKPALTWMLDLVKGLAGGILDVTAYLGDFFTELNKSQKEQKVFETFFNTLTKYLGYLGDFLKKVGQAFSETFFKDTGNEGTTFIDKVFEFIGRVGDLANEAMNNFSFNIDFTPIQEFFQKISTFGFSTDEMGTTKNIFESSKEFVLQIFDWLKTVFGTLFSGKGDNAIAQSGATSATGSKLSDTIENVLNWIQGLITTLIENTDPALLAAGTLTGLALVLDSLAGILDSLLSGIASILTVVLGFKAEKDIKKLGDKTIKDPFAGIDKLANSIDKFANTTVPTLVDSVKKAAEEFKPLDLGGKDSVGEQIKKVLVSIAALILAIAVGLFIIAVIPTADLVKAIATLVGIVTLIAAFVAVFALLTKVIAPVESMVKNPLTGIAVAFAVVSLSLIEIAIAVTVIADALKGLTLGQIIGVIATITAILLVISGIMALFTIAQKTVNSSGMAVLASDYVALAGAFALFGLAIIQIGAAIAMVTMAIGVLGEDGIKKAWGAVAMISVLLAIVTGFLTLITLFIKDNPEGMVSVLAAGGAILMALEGLTSVILAMTAMFLVLSMMDETKIDKAMDVMKGIIIAVGVIIAVLGVIALLAGVLGEMGSIGLLAMAAMLLSFAIAVAAVAIPLAAAALALQAFSKVLEQFKELVEYMKDLDEADADRAGKNIATVIGRIAEGVPKAMGKWITTGIDTLKELLPRYLSFFNNDMIPFIGKALTSSATPISEKVVEVILAILTTVGTYFPDIIDVLYDLFFGPGQIYDSMVKWGDEFWDRTVDWLHNRIDIWVEDIADLLLQLIHAINLAMEGKWDEFDEEISKLLQNTMDFIENIINDAKTQAKFDELLAGIAEAIKKAATSDETKEIIHNAFKDLAGAAIAGFIEGLSDDRGLSGLNFFDEIRDWKFGSGGVNYTGITSSGKTSISKDDYERIKDDFMNGATKSQNNNNGGISVIFNQSSDANAVTNTVTRVRQRKTKAGSDNSAFVFGIR